MSDRRGETSPEPASPSPAPEVEEAKFVEMPPAAKESAGAKPRPLPLAWLALVAVLAAVALAPYWAPPIASILPWGPRGAETTAAADARIDALDRRNAAVEARLAESEKALPRLAALEQRVTQAESRLANLAAGAQDGQQTAKQQAQVLAALADRLAILEQRVAALAAASSGGASADTVKALDAEIKILGDKLAAQEQALAKLQIAASGGPERVDAALIVAVGQLRQVLATSRPYASELRAAKALARDRPEITAELQKLDTSAERGIPGLAVLSDRLAQIAPAVLSAEPPPLGAGWGDRMLLRVKRFFNLRRVGEGSAEAGGAEGALAAAQTAMQGGDLAAAVAAMKRLRGPAAELAARWLADAEARLGAEATVAALDAALLQRFLAGPGAAKQ